jgi:protein-S-isoprenylcysteine O-methyltransferase Ste14
MDMKSELIESQTVVGRSVTLPPDARGNSRSVTPEAGRNALKRNFILQQGFEDPGPALRARQYSALTFQPRVVLVLVVAGTLFQSPAVFAILCALLWWSALLPKLNPFSALYNLTAGGRPGASRLGPAPAPRRGAETMAGAFALTTALLILAGFHLAAYAFQAIFLAASLAVELAGFCFGTFAYHLRRGNVKFALETLPWAKNEMRYEAKGDETVMNNRVTAPGIATGGSTKTAPGRTHRIAVFAYGTVAYAICLGVFVYAIGFIGNFGVPKAMDSGRESSLARALLINSLLLGVFAIQHSVMARSWFKQWLTRAVPWAAERSTYVLFSSLALILLFWQWRPMGGTIWNVQNPAGRAVLLGLYAAGWTQVLITTFLINHFDLFGIRQVYLHLRGREVTPLKFVTPGPYKVIRHPLYVGWLMVFWMTPTMTVAHLLFAVMTTAYILVAIQFEEGDLVKAHGWDYAEYRKQVPMFIPRLMGKESVGRKAAASSAAGRSGGVTPIQAGGA